VASRRASVSPGALPVIPTWYPGGAAETRDALAWFVAHRRERLEVALTTGGLTIKGPALYDGIDQEDDDAFGVILPGLRFWII